VRARVDSAMLAIVSLGQLGGIGWCGVDAGQEGEARELVEGVASGPVPAVWRQATTMVCATATSAVAVLPLTR
jgi:hypothetical protein